MRRELTNQNYFIITIYEKLYQFWLWGKRIEDFTVIRLLVRYKFGHNEIKSSQHSQTMHLSCPQRMQIFNTRPLLILWRKPASSVNDQPALLTSSIEVVKTKDMAKKKVHHKKAQRSSRQSAPKESYFVVIRSWMLLVMFALMLGLGAVVGTYLNQQSNGVPVVAGAQTSR